MKLKMITLNLHCFEERTIEENQALIAKAIHEMDADVVFLQEVAQTQIKKGINPDNYGLTLQKLLKSIDSNYYYVYDLIKASFGKYDEGLGILSKTKVITSKSEVISKTNDYLNWKTRKLLICETEIKNHKMQFASTHFGWSDGYEVFEDQFDVASDICNRYELVFLAGDFNMKYNSNEYNYVVNKGWIDVFKQDKTLSSAPTFVEDTLGFFHHDRLDYIFCNKSVDLIRGEILFMDPKVSDHYGVFAEVDIL